MLRQIKFCHDRVWPGQEFFCRDIMFLYHDRVGNGGEALCRDRVWPNGEILCCGRKHHVET